MALSWWKQPAYLCLGVALASVTRREVITTDVSGLGCGAVWNGRGAQDAEPKYLIAVQPIPANDVKKQCTGQVNLQKPLHLIIGSVTPSSVLLSWGTFLNTPFDGDIMNDCLEDGYYTVRYREKERNKKWNYENCPVSDTVIDRLKPNTQYEFGVRASKGKEDGLWSKPVFHQTNAGSNGDGRILPNGEERILPNGEKRILPNGERRVLPNGEGRVLPNGEGRILPKPFNATQRHTHYWGNGDVSCFIMYIA
ncbi:UNVERIFIED_CONTAM: hypothetical protein FKN15_018256 [Acipenser sinensis]